MENKHKIKELLEKLVKIDSPSGQESELANFLLNYTESIGFCPIKDEKNNITINPESNFWIVTHMDTVSKKAEFRIDKDSAYGTGVCDAKGCITAILITLEKIKKLKFGVAFLVDEEEGGTGSEFVLRKFKPQIVIVMEPTSLRIANKHYGSLEIVLKIKGEEVHGAYFKHAKTAIDNAILVINTLKAHGLNFLIQEIKGGSDEYLTPPECFLRLDFPVPPEIKANNLKRRILDTISNTLALSDFEYKILEECNGFTEQDPPKELITAMKLADVMPQFAEMVSWTDAINFKKAGCKTVVWGPGDLRFCHTRYEKIKINEIHVASKVLYQLNNIL